MKIFEKAWKYFVREIQNDRWVNIYKRSFKMIVNLIYLFLNSKCIVIIITIIIIISIAQKKRTLHRHWIQFWIIRALPTKIRDF